MIQVVNRALDILEYLAKDPRAEYGLGEIADQTGLHHATCANIIKTLVRRQYLEKIDRKRGYRLGWMAYHLTHNYSFQQELITAAAKPMRQLREKIQEGCILTILRQNVRLIIHEEKSEQELSVRQVAEKPAYHSSTGRLMLAYESEAAQERFIYTYGLPDADIWPGIQSAEELMDELQQIREKGLAIQVSPAHVVGLAAPVRYGNDRVAALGVYLPELRFTPARRRLLIEWLRQTTEEIAQRLTNNTD